MEGCDAVGLGDQLVLVPVLSDHDDVVGGCDLLEIWLVRTGLLEIDRQTNLVVWIEKKGQSTICHTKLSERHESEIPSENTFST